MNAGGKGNRTLNGLCFVILIFFVNASTLHAQSRDSLYQINKDKIIVIKNNKFKVYNNWLNFGAGGANNFTRFGRQFTLGADYNFHIHAEYLQAGFYFIGDRFGYYNNYNYHLGFGRRKETANINFAVFGGIAYSTGYRKVDGVFATKNVYDKISGYVNVQFTKKVTYDTGLGLSLYADYNSYQFIAGLRLDVYFSGAYRGKAKKTGTD